MLARAAKRWTFPDGNDVARYTNDGVIIYGLAQAIRGCFAIPRGDSRADPRLIFAGENGETVTREVLALAQARNATPDELDACVALNTERHTLLHLSMLALANDMWALAERAVLATQEFEASLLLLFICHHGLYKCVGWREWPSARCDAARVTDYFEYECHRHPSTWAAHSLVLVGPPVMSVYDCITTGTASDNHMARTLRTVRARVDRSPGIIQFHQGSYPYLCARSCGPLYTVAVYETMLGGRDPGKREPRVLLASSISIACDAATHALSHHNTATAWALMRRWSPLPRKMAFPRPATHVTAEMVEFVVTYCARGRGLTHMLLCHVGRGNSYAARHLASMIIDRLPLCDADTVWMATQLLEYRPYDRCAHHAILWELRRRFGPTRATKLLGDASTHSYYHPNVRARIARSGLMPPGMVDVQLWELGRHPVHRRRNAACATLARLRNVGSAVSGGTPFPVDVLRIIGDFVAIEPAVESRPQTRTTRSRTATKRAMDGLGPMAKRQRYHEERDGM